MCGIVGYIGRARAVPILLDGLRRLEYRGYDSAGIATLSNGKIDARKCKGRISSLAELIQKDPPKGDAGIGHTRWATHGGVTDENAHPHFDQSGKLALVHNGVIENYQALKEELLREGHTFKSQTDTEVLAHLIGKHYDAAVAGVRPRPQQSAAHRGVARRAQAGHRHVRHRDDASGGARISFVGARRGSPLVLGVGKDENFLASDVSAIVAHTRDAVYLNDYDIVSIDRDSFEIASLLGGTSGYEVSKVEFTAEDVSKGDYPHYMLKEIFEQPETVRDAMRGRLSREEATAKLGGLEMTPKNCARSTALSSPAAAPPATPR